VVKSESLQGVQSRQAESWEDSHGFRWGTDGIVDLGCNSIQIDEQKKGPNRQGSRSGYGFHAPGGRATGCHGVLPKGYFLPQRENRGPLRGVHQGFGQKGGSTGEWRLQSGEWRVEGTNGIRASRSHLINGLAVSELLSFQGFGPPEYYL
jgi:hypothetical protein